MAPTRSELDALHASSRSIHAGRTVDLGHATPTVPPIHIATAFTYPTTAELDEVFEDNTKGYVYSRYGNPTVRALEEAVAAIEGTDDAVAFGTGMSAIHGVITTLVRPGQRIIASRDVYGATYALLRSILAETGIETTFADMQDLPALADLANELRPALIFAETVSNPLIRVVDVQRIASIAHAAGAAFALDNTFATPVITNGRALGADAVIYSSTKHLGGHGDTTGGVVATGRELTRAIRERNKVIGAFAAPFDAWLVLRGLRTLDLRVRKQSVNAAALVDWLAVDDRIDAVNYPGLSGVLPHGQFADGLRGSMLSFEISGADRATVFRFQDALNLIQPATTLGDVYTLVLHPATSSHRALTAEERAEIGIAEGLVRLSAGIEDVSDVINDLDQALDTALRGKARLVATVDAVAKQSR